MNKIPQCIVPWVYMEIFPDGTVTPCCANMKDLGNLKDKSIEEIWNDTEMNNFRLEMFDDVLPESCASCKLVESYGQSESRVNLREIYNKFFASSFADVERITNDDGSLNEIKFKGWDFKISNKCNFKCRTCIPELSSGVNEENKQNNLQHFDGILDHSKDLKIKEFIDNHINNFELIEFAGGETLLMDEQYHLLQTLIDNKRTDITLWYNTNMSILKYKDHDILKYWRQWDPDKLTVIASIDEIGARAEYVRKGTVWKTIENNLKTISKEKFKRHTITVVSCYNVFRLPEIINYLIDIGHISEDYNYRNFDLSFEMGDFNIRLLPDKFKEKIKEKLMKFIDEYPVDISDIFYYTLKILDEPMDVDLAKRFLMLNAKVDKIRNENGFVIVPELFELVKYFREFK